MADGEKCKGIRALNRKGKIVFETDRKNPPPPHTHTHTNTTFRF